MVLTYLSKDGEEGCICPDIIVMENGDIKGCSCKDAPKFGTVFHPIELPDYWLWAECSHDQKHNLENVKEIWTLENGSTFVTHKTPEPCYAE